MSNSNYYQELHERFYNEQFLNNGDRAVIRRAGSPEDLEVLPAYYKLLGSKANRNLANVVYILPMIKKHVDNSKPLGELLNNSNLSEKRLFHIVRSDQTQSLIQLKRAITQAKIQKINWETLGKSLYHWGNPNKFSKKQLLKNYYTTTSKEDNQ